MRPPLISGMKTDDQALSARRLGNKKGIPEIRGEQGVGTRRRGYRGRSTTHRVNTHYTTVVREYRNLHQGNRGIRFHPQHREWRQRVEELIAAGRLPADPARGLGCRDRGTQRALCSSPVPNPRIEEAQEDVGEAQGQGEKTDGREMTIRGTRYMPRDRDQAKRKEAPWKERRLSLQKNDHTPNRRDKRPPRRKT